MTSIWNNLSQEEILQKEQMLENMKTTIEGLTKNQHIEVLRILKKDSNIKINENRNGLYINMSYIPNETIEILSKYLDYIKEQEQNLEQLEIKKEEIKSFFD